MAALDELLDKAQTDETLMAALRTATTNEDILRIAAEHGVPLSPDDLDTDTQLTDADLESMAGGRAWPTMEVFCGTVGNFCTYNPYACQA